MNIEYRILEEEDWNCLLSFMEDVGYTEKLIIFVQKNFSINPFFKVSAEIVDNKINGIMIACSYGVICECPEVLPIWVGLRIDRKTAIYSFTEFVDKTSIFMTDYFEGVGYYQHYIVRRMPKKSISFSNLSKITERGWAQGNYTTLVEREVRTIEDYDKLPVFYKMIIGKFRIPVYVLCMYLPNEFRKTYTNDTNIVSNCSNVA